MRKRKMSFSKKTIIFVILTVVVIVVAGWSTVWYMTPVKVTVYVSYPYNTNGTFRVVIDGHVLASEDNYSFNYLPPYTRGYEKSLPKGMHVISIYDSTYKNMAEQKFDMWSDQYIMVDINENGIRFHVQQTQPIFL